MEPMQERIARYMASLENASPGTATSSPTTSYNVNNINYNCLALRHQDSDSDVSEASSSSRSSGSCEDVETGLSRVDSFSGNNNRPARIHALLLGQLCSQRNCNVNSTAGNIQDCRHRQRDRTRHEPLNRQCDSSSSGNRRDDLNGHVLTNRSHSQGHSPDRDSREASHHLWHNQHHSRPRHSSSSSSCRHSLQQQQQRKLHQQAPDQGHHSHRHRRHRSGSVSSAVKDSPNVTHRHQQRREEADVAESDQQGPQEHERGRGSESPQLPQRSGRRLSVSRHHQKKHQHQQHSTDNEHVASAHPQPGWRQRRSSGTVYPKVTPEDLSQDRPENCAQQPPEGETNLNAARETRSPKRYVYPDLSEEQDLDIPQSQPRSKPQTPSRRKSSVRDSPQHEAWLDTYPRTRLHTVSGTGSDLRTSLCHAMSRVHVSQASRRGRATSLKKAKKKTLELTGEFHNFRPRTCSLPARNPYCRPHHHHLSPPLPPLPQGDFYTLRSFQTTRKGHLVKRGDSLKSRSSNSVRSSGSGSVTELAHPPSSSPASMSPGGGGGGESGGPASPAHPLPLPPSYSVLMVGGEGVGKSSLTRQFSTSEYLGPFDLNAGE